MVDNRFPSVGVDARFPSPGTDVRFPTPGEDLEHLPDGTDTRFEGGTYGGDAGAPPSLSAQMQAMLLGTNGVAFDPTDNSTMWLEDAKTTQLTGDGQTVGCIRSKWGNAQYELIQPDPTARPLRQGGKFMVPDAVNDFLTYDGGAFATFQNAPAYFMAGRMDDTVAQINNDGLFRVSTAAAGGQRIDVVNATGRMRTRVRRADADAVTDNFGVTGNFYDAGVTTIAFSLNLITGGAIKIRNNVDTDTYAHGAGGNSENLASARIRLFASLATTANFFSARPVGRSVMLPFVPSAGQRTLIQAWLTEF